MVKHPLQRTVSHQVCEIVDAPAAAGPAAGPKAEDAAEQDEPLSMDEVVERCLLGGLLAVPEAELPIMASDFYTKYMLPCRPPGNFCSPVTNFLHG